MYRRFDYLKPRKFFHTFEAHSCPAALNFADEQEAEKFFEAVQSKRKIMTSKKIKNDNLNIQQSNASQPTQVSKVRACGYAS